MSLKLVDNSRVSTIRTSCVFLAQLVYLLECGGMIRRQS